MNVSAMLNVTAATSKVALTEAAGGPLSVRLLACEEVAEVQTIKEVLVGWLEVEMLACVKSWMSELILAWATWATTATA